MSEEYNYCHVVGKTDVGRKRAANEDSMHSAITRNGLASVVCDGMGGHVGGATASKVAVAAIMDNLNAVYYDDPRIAIGESIDVANRAILQKTVEQPELAGMGSTCVLLLVRDGKVYIGHVGDSRIYLVRSKRIVQLTKDHSYVQMLVDCGEITKEQAEHHPRKNEITNALGIRNMSPATVADDAIIPEAGDCFVLCSDGLSGMVSDETICKVVSRQTEMNAQERVNRLVELANANGGVDNITVQLVEFPVSPNDAGTVAKRKVPAWAGIAVVSFLLVAIAGIGAYVWLMPKDTKNKIYNVCLGDVTFEKSAQIVELIYGDDEFCIRRGDIFLYKKDSVRFESDSLKIETDGVEVKYNNSVIQFADTVMADSVVFVLSGKACVYRFRLNVIKREPKTNSSSLPNGISNTTTGTGTSTKTKKAPKANLASKIDSIPITFNCSQLENGAMLSLTYSTNLVLSFNGKAKSVPLQGFKKFDDTKMKYDKHCWSLKGHDESLSLTFTFKGEQSCGQKEFIFTVPCEMTDKSKMVISIKLVHNVSGGVNSKEESAPGDDNTSMPPKTE